MKKTSLRSVEELLNRIRRLEMPVVFYITLEPFSAMIINQLVKLQTLRERNKLFEEIFNHPDMEIIRIKDMIIINEYGKMVEIESSTTKNDRYVKQIKGFL